MNYKYKKFEFISDEIERDNKIIDAKRYIIKLNEKNCNQNASNSSLTSITSSELSPPVNAVEASVLPLTLISNRGTSTPINLNCKKKHEKFKSIFTRIQDKTATVNIEKSILEIEIDN